MIGGGIWPVVHRELRAGARRPVNHWLRVAGAAGGVGVFWISAVGMPISAVGSPVFIRLHRLLLLTILCVVPAITADCIARERREGTLGLLFLTPLRSWEIVIGKVGVQVLKAVTLWLAVVPVLTIPFLSGGVTMKGVAHDLAAELCVGILCLAAGIVASSLTARRSTAFVFAYLLTAALVFGLTEEQWWNLLHTGTGLTSTTLMRRLQTGAGGVFTYYARSYAARVNPAGTGAAITSYLPMSGRLVFSLLVLWCAIRFAGYRVEHSWMDKIPATGGNSWSRVCGMPLFRRGFERSMRRTLEWNPIAWLQQYSWQARLTKWGLCLGAALLVSMASEAGDFRIINDREVIVFAVLTAAYTYAGVNGFLQEKKSGALELILVTPLTVNEVILGRVWGLWKQFFPAALLLLASHLLARSMDPFWGDRARNSYYYGAGFLFRPNNIPDLRSQLVECLGYFMANDALWEFALVLGFVALPVYATLAALRVKNIVLAAAYTWLNLLAATMAGLLIWMAFSILPGTDQFDSSPDGKAMAMRWVFGGMLASHAAFVALALWKLRQRLAKREYSF